MAKDDFRKTIQLYIESEVMVALAFRCPKILKNADSATNYGMSVKKIPHKSPNKS